MYELSGFLIVGAMAASSANAALPAKKAARQDFGGHYYVNSDSSHLVHDMQTEAISRSTFNLTQVAACGSDVGESDDKVFEPCKNEHI